MTKDIQDRARDIQDRVGQFLGSDSGRQLVGTAVSELLRGLVTKKPIGRDRSRNTGQALSGARGVAVGAGAAAIAPAAVRGVGKLFSRNGVAALAAGPRKLVEGAASKLGDGISHAPGRKRTSRSSGQRQTAQRRRGASSGQTRARAGRSAARGSAGSSSSQRRSRSASGSSQRRSRSASSSSQRRSTSARSSNGRKTSARGRTKTSRSSSNSSAAHQGRQRSRSSRRS